MLNSFSGFLVFGISRPVYSACLVRLFLEEQVFLGELSEPVNLLSLLNSVTIVKENFLACFYPFPCVKHDMSPSLDVYDSRDAVNHTIKRIVSILHQTARKLSVDLSLARQSVKVARAE